MKNKNFKLMVISLLCLFLLGMSGCTKKEQTPEQKAKEESKEKENSEKNFNKAHVKFKGIAPNFEMLSYNETNYIYTFEAYDKESNILYLIHCSFGGPDRGASATFTPLLNSDGTYRLYKK